MANTGVQLEFELTPNSPTGQRGLEDLQDMNDLELRSLLAGVALAPPSGDQVTRRCYCEACSCMQAILVEESFQTMQLQLQFLLTKADDLQNCVVNGEAHLNREAVAAALTSFLYTCQPYFNLVECTARSTTFQSTPLSLDIYTRLLDFSQRLCDRLEQLVLTYASFNIICLDESEPNGLSHFFIGQSHLGPMRLSAFFYCKPVPYLATVSTGIYKRMRWNVDRLEDEKQQQPDEEQGGESEQRTAETICDTEYYFLCYEDLPSPQMDGDGDEKGVSCDVVRMWSIGQWVQLNPDPDKEDIYDWIMCDVPQASYQKLLLLGSNEPPSSSATDLLLQLLLSQPAKE